MALTDYDKSHLSESQQAAVEQATRDWNDANARGDTAGMAAAHAAAEAARNSGGYSSDSWGNYSGSYSGGSSGSGSSSDDSGGIITARSVAVPMASNDSPRNSVQSGGTQYSIKMPDMSRNELLAGQTVFRNGMNVTYDDRGYAVSATNPGHSLYKDTERAFLAPSYEAVVAGLTGADRSQYGGSDYDKQYFTDAQLKRADQLRAQAAAGEISWKDAHQYAEDVRNSYGYSGGADGGQFERIAPLHEWNNGWGGNYNPGGLGGGMTYADAYRAGLLGNGAGGVTLTADAQRVLSGMAAPGATGATGTTGSGLADQLAALYGEEGPYAKALAELQAANKLAVQNAVMKLERQQQDVNDEYNTYYRQAYIDKMNAMKDLNQRLAAQGVTGGAAESTMLGLNANYQNALRDAEKTRIGTINSLDQAIAEAQLTGDMKNAEAAMSAAEDQTARYASILQSLLNREDTLKAQADEQARSEQSSSQAWARQLATQLLAGGNMPDDATLSAAGITREQAAALLTPAESGSSTYTPGFSRAQVMDAYNRAAKAGTSLTGNLLRDYNYYLYGDPDYLGAATSIQSSAAPSRTGGGVSYDNGGYSREEIRQLQALLGVTQDGYYGPETRKAAGGMSAAEAMTAMQEYLGSGASGGYNSVLGDVQALKQNGASNAEINSVLSAAMQQGTISNQQMLELRKAITNNTR